MTINLGSTIIDLINEINSKDSVTIDSIDGLKGGTLKSPITFKGGDAATASKAILDQNNQGQVTDTSTATLLGFNSAKEFLVGSNNYKTVIRGNSNSTIGDKKISDLAVKSDIPAKVEETLVGYLMDSTVNQVIYWDADNEEFTSRDVTELETKVVGNATPTSEPITLNILQIEDKFYKLPSNYVKLTGDQTIDGVKIFKAPADVSGTDVATTKFKTSNGGVIIIGKEGANSGVMLRFDQTEGTCRLRFRGSATAGAMVWEQPEKAAKLYFDMGNDAGTGKNRVALRNKAGTLALTSELPSAVSANPTLSGSETELTGLKIGSTNYKVPSGGGGGTEVVPNGSILSSPIVLNSLNIDGKTYRINTITPNIDTTGVTPTKLNNFAQGGTVYEIPKIYKHRLYITGTESGASSVSCSLDVIIYSTKYSSAITKNSIKNDDFQGIVGTLIRTKSGTVMSRYAMEITYASSSSIYVLNTDTSASTASVGIAVQNVTDTVFEV